MRGGGVEMAPGRSYRLERKLRSWSLETKYNRCDRLDIDLFTIKKQFHQ